MQLNSPVSDSKIERLIDTVDLTSESRAVDFGCGNGEFLIRLYKKSRASCLGVDIDASNVAVANKKLNDLPGASVEFRQSDAKTVSLDNESFDLTVCMGSSHAFAEGKSAYESAIAFMQKALKKNGMILIGEGYWKRDPEPEYLDFLGEPVGVYNSFEENIAVAESAGFVPVYATESSLDEWDHFEWNFVLKAERAVISNPDDLELRKKLDRVRAWNASFREYGRSTMGYGHYIFLKR